MGKEEFEAVGTELHSPYRCRFGVLTCVWRELSEQTSQCGETVGVFALGDGEFRACCDGRRFDGSFADRHVCHASAAQSAGGFGEAGEEEQSGSKCRPDRSLLVGEDGLEIVTRILVGGGRAAARYRQYLSGCR